MKAIRALRLDMQGLFNSFRFEKSHVYHRTYEMPPKTDPPPIHKPMLT